MTAQDPADWGGAQESAPPSLLQIFQHEFFGDLGKTSIGDREILALLNSAGEWAQFQTLYNNLNNPEFQSFIIDRLSGFQAELSKQLVIALETKTDLSEISAALSKATYTLWGLATTAVMASATSAAAGSAVAATVVGTVADVTLFGGMGTCAVAIGTIVVRNYLAREAAQTEQQIDLVKSRKLLLLRKGKKRDRIANKLS
jgi:hypothetical protein